MAGVGTRKVFEDDQIVTWYFDLAPGEQGEMHFHEHDYVVRILSGARLEVCGPDGEVLYQTERSAGDMACFRVEGNLITSDFPGSTPIPRTHSVRNIGETAFRELLIEFKI